METEEKMTKKCPKCQTEIPIKAKKCPQCQSDLRNWFRRHPILTGLGIIILFLIIVGKSTGDRVEKVREQAQTNVSATEQTEETPQTESLELVSMNCYREYDYFIIEGMVKNISDKPLESVLAVGNTYTENGEFVKSSDALIEYNPILSGQSSPFKTMTTDNPAIKKCKVDFKEFWGGTIPTKDGRVK